MAPPSWRSPPSSFTGISGSVSPNGCSAVRGPAKRISRPPCSTQSRQLRRAPRPPAAACRPGSARTGRACSSVVQVALAHLGVRRQGAAQVIQRPGERRVGGGDVAGEHARPAGGASARRAAPPSRRTGRAFQHQPARAGCAARAAARWRRCRCVAPAGRSIAARARVRPSPLCASTTAWLAQRLRRLRRARATSRSGLVARRQQQARPAASGSAVR